MIEDSGYLFQIRNVFLRTLNAIQINMLSEVQSRRGVRILTYS